MDWLTKAFAQYNVTWIVLSAVVGLLSGAVSSWITYQFKNESCLRQPNSSGRKLLLQ